MGHKIALQEILTPFILLSLQPNPDFFIQHYCERQGQHWPSNSNCMAHICVMSRVWPLATECLPLLDSIYCLLKGRHVNWSKSWRISSKSGKKSNLTFDKFRLSKHINRQNISIILVSNSKPPKDINHIPCTIKLIINFLNISTDNCCISEAFVSITMALAVKVRHWKSCNNWNIGLNTTQKWEIKVIQFQCRFGRTKE